jgi:hypothetical protein
VVHPRRPELQAVYDATSRHTKGVPQDSAFQAVSPTEVEQRVCQRSVVIRGSHGRRHREGLPAERLLTSG